MFQLPYHYIIKREDASITLSLRKCQNRVRDLILNSQTFSSMMEIDIKNSINIISMGHRLTQSNSTEEYTLKDKIWSHFDLKSWFTGGIKLYLGFRVIGEYLSQIDSIVSVKLSIWQFDGSNFIPPMTQLFRSKWLPLFLPACNC